MEQEPEKDKAERWLLTYADLITLLLIFFIILYTISKQDAVKFKAISESIIDAFHGTRHVVGEAPGPSHVPGRAGRLTEAAEPEEAAPEPEAPPRKNLLQRFGEKFGEKQQMREIAAQVEKMMDEQELHSSVSVAVTGRGVAIRIVDRLIFKSGEAELTPQAYKVLSDLGKILLTDKEHFLRIEGHTDNEPIFSERYPSNWELSAARALTVVQLFVQEIGVEPRRISQVGYGEFRPAADNATQGGRAKNRRVEIVLLNREFNESEAR